MKPYLPGLPSGQHRDLMRDRWSPKSDEIFGEMIEVRPMTRRGGANVQQTPDDRRKPFCVAAIFRAPREPVAVSQSDVGKGLMIGLDKPSFSIALAACPWAIQRGDVLVRIDRGDYYEVHGMRADSIHIRGIFEVVELGIQSGLGGNAFD